MLALCTVIELAHIVQKPASFVLVQMFFSTNLFSDAMIEHKEILLGQLFFPAKGCFYIVCYQRYGSESSQILNMSGYHKEVAWMQIV